jgi:hypothetical protein
MCLGRPSGQQRQRLGSPRIDAKGQIAGEKNQHHHLEGNATNSERNIFEKNHGRLDNTMEF